VRIKYISLGIVSLSLTHLLNLRGLCKPRSRGTNQNTTTNTSVKKTTESVPVWLCGLGQLVMSDLTDEQLRSIYAWIDAIPLSRPKRNIARDFSDGCMLAEVISAYFPELVELHNYSAANSTQQKMYNFETLNQRVLRKFDYQLSRSVIDDIVNCKAGVVESVLNTLQYKMAKYREKKKKVKNPSTQSPPETPSYAASQDVYPSDDQRKGKQIKAKQKPTPNVSVQVSVDEELLLEKEEQIRELQETVEILELKIAKLEQLVRLKDNKIQKLLSQK
jgi:hypothetical protein